MSDQLTVKQQAFVLAYVETGNASEAYRRAYNAKDMAPATINRKAAELLAHGKITARIDQLQSKAAAKAVLNRSWVLDRLMKNARICMGEEKIKVTITPKEGEPFDHEITDRDAAAANKALELLGKTDEARVFVDRQEISGPGGGPIEINDASKLALARWIGFMLTTAADNQPKLPPPE